MNFSAEASDADKAVFEALSEGPSAAEYPHLARWYNHIAAVQGLSTKYVYLLFFSIFNMFWVPAYLMDPVFDILFFCFPPLFPFPFLFPSFSFFCHTLNCFFQKPFVFTPLFWEPKKKANK